MQLKASYLQRNSSSYFAGIFTKTTPDKKYQSIGAKMSVWNPLVRGPFQYSSVAISVEATFGTDFEQIQLGWTVSIKEEK